MVDQADDGAGAPQGTDAPGRGERTSRERKTGRLETRWPAKVKDTFFNRLAATCNVQESAETAGMPLSSVYALRRRDPAFAARWREALTLGYEMLETRLVGYALAGGATDGERSAPIDVPLALRLLTIHRAALAGKPTKRGRPPQTATREETNAAILKKLRVMEAQQRAETEALSGRSAAALAIVDGRTGLVACDTANGDT